MSKVIDDSIVTTFSFSVHGIEQHKDIVFDMIKSFRVMSSVTKHEWDIIVDNIVNDKYDTINKNSSIMDLFEKRVSIKADPLFRSIRIIDPDGNTIVIGYSNGYYETMISLTKADKLDPITKDELLNFFTTSKTIH